MLLPVRLEDLFQVVMVNPINSREQILRPEREAS